MGDKTEENGCRTGKITGRGRISCINMSVQAEQSQMLKRHLGLFLKSNRNPYKDIDYAFSKCDKLCFKCLDL